ncbi:metallophosphoesterase [Winogradskyella sp. PG-2]|uniref:metallophosphoesterase n=1 Tax=Winogradskyella sp. PG-2 TaxID=754409 RepID=UPI001184F146|nr:metallophosphoesterase [Winogradskyella sp. PG-2]
MKILKWGAKLIFGYWFLTTLIFGHTELNTKTGIQSFGWSGLDALFSEQEFGFFIDEPYKTNLDGADGPYIFDNIKYWVNDEDKLKKKKFDRQKPIEVTVNNEVNDKFEITLKNSHQNEPEFYDFPPKLIAISDIEGNFNALHSFLINNKVIDKSYNWIFGEGHLVLNGDFFDRGQSVTQTLWLIYSLEKKAEEQNGKVHFINGNHEIMNLNGDMSHSLHRYVEVAKRISKETHWDEASKFLYSEKSELGKWLRTKNVIEKIGQYIFVHGGLNKKIIDADLRINDINKIAKAYYGKKFENNTHNLKEKLVVQSQSSPYWDRSLATNIFNKTVFFFNGASLKKTSQTELDSILNFYKTNKIVIGHSVVDNVSADYNGKVIKIDVKHGLKKNSIKTEGLLIENGIEYRVNGLGEKKRI